MLYQFSDRVGLNRNEPLVASMLPIFLLENEAGDSTHFSFFGGDVFSPEVERGVGLGASLEACFNGDGDKDDWLGARARARARAKKRRWPESFVGDTGG
ncbi:hypothetical protein V6N13_084469 [Hibiscus sabdariffa]|uniref:Uncharacterized protein n=1 Tax=Hibiscus sabdariffa TaxID=183260 RepID=A0ABR2T139_9ROSI